MKRATCCLVIVAALLAPAAALAERTKLKPGFNLFSPQQDVELGRQAAQETQQKVPMLNDRRVDDYLTRLGRKLAATASGPQYPWEFRAVNDSSINAFALPGGFLFVNRGTIEAADNEAQLAGVMGHEMGHVLLRHGTNQVSKAYIAQAPLAILGGLSGSSIGGVLARLGGSLAVNSLLLKYSRDDERQADILGTQILADSGYDPRALPQFFEKLESRGRGSDFFSDHPNPENRIQNINAEISKIGVSRRSSTGSSDFDSIKRYVQSLPKPPKNGSRSTTTQPSRGNGRPQLPSGRLQTFRSGDLTLRYPDNWTANGQGDAFTIAPDGGILDGGAQEGSSVAYGVTAGYFSPRSDRHRSVGVEEATDQLIDSLTNSNPNMRVQQDHGNIRVGGERGMSTFLTNRSPLGGQETDWLVTVDRPDGLFYMVFVAPQQDFDQYRRTFEDMVSSIRFVGSR